jgi:hypothetical protein
MPLHTFLAILTSLAQMLGETIRTKANTIAICEQLKCSNSAKYYSPVNSYTAAIYTSWSSLRGNTIADDDGYQNKCLMLKLQPRLTLKYSEAV